MGLMTLPAVCFFVAFSASPNESILTPFMFPEALLLVFFLTDDIDLREARDSFADRFELNVGDNFYLGD